MTHQFQVAEKNRLLRQLLQLLAARGIARSWAQSEDPYSDLEHECIRVIEDVKVAAQIEKYIRANPVIQLSVQTFLAHISVAANVRVEQIPWPQQILTPVGTRIARWLPTFLVIDGPLGRFIRFPDSPLNQLLRSKYTTYPTLAQVRDIFNHDLFRRVRNGVGHWAFSWEDDAKGGHLICYDWESGERSAEVSVLEAEALHVVSFSVIECFDKRIFKIY